MISEVAHQMGLVPIVAMVVAGRRLPAPYWLVALAFAMSWLADSLAHALGGPWDAVYWWLLPQFLLAVAALTRGWARLMWLTAVTVVGVLALALTSGPDWLLTLSGSVAVLLLARGLLTIPLAIYFGAGSAAYFWMLASMSDILPAWYAYQGCRAAAYGAFVGLILIYRTGATHGLDHGGATRPARGTGTADRGETLARPAGRDTRQGTLEG